MNPPICDRCGRELRSAGHTLCGYLIYLLCNCEQRGRYRHANLQGRAQEIEDEIRRDYFNGYLTKEKYRDALREVEELLRVVQN